MKLFKLNIYRCELKVHITHYLNDDVKSKLNTRSSKSVSVHSVDGINKENKINVKILCIEYRLYCDEMIETVHCSCLVVQPIIY